MPFSSDSEYIESNGAEKATLTATLTEAGGYPIPHETDISITLVSGPGTFKTITTLTPALGGGLTLAPGSTFPVLQLLAKISMHPGSRSLLPNQTVFTLNRPIVKWRTQKV